MSPCSSVSMSTLGTMSLGSIRLGCHRNWSRSGCVSRVLRYGYSQDWDGVLGMRGGATWECEQWVAKDHSLGIMAPYVTKSFHEVRGDGVLCVMSTTDVA